MHITRAFQLQSLSGRREGVGLGQIWASFFFKLCKLRARLRSYVVMLSSEYSGGDRLSGFELQEVHFKECVSAARLFGFTFVKSKSIFSYYYVLLMQKQGKVVGGGLFYHGYDRNI